MRCECWPQPSCRESNSCDPMRRKESTQRMVNRFGSGENLRDGAGRCAGAPGSCGMALAVAVLSLNRLTHPLTFVAISMPARRVMSSVMIARPILTRGGGGRDATRASHKRSHSAPGNFIAMASTPDASRLRREADFRGPKKEGGAGGGLAPSATNQPSIRAAVLSGQSHTTL